MIRFFGYVTGIICAHARLALLFCSFSDKHHTQLLHTNAHPVYIGAFFSFLFLHLSSPLSSTPLRSNYNLSSLHIQYILTPPSSHVLSTTYINHKKYTSQIMSFAWSATFTIGQPADTAKGDKIILPQAALESIIHAHASAPPPPLIQPDPNYDPTSWAHPQFNPREPTKSQELPSPLTFQIRNPANRLLTHGGVKEFSAVDGQVHLPPWMMASLALSPGDQVMVKYAALPKGTWAKFRPLSADYMEILDFRALLEARLRSNYTTLTRGEVLRVHQGTKEFGFVVEELKPEPGEAVCITDTDLEVDIEPLDSEMDDVTNQHTSGILNGQGSRKESVLKIGIESQGRVSPEAYQRWTVDIPNRKSGIDITVHVQEPGDLDVLVSTKLPISLQDHLWANFESVGPRVITIPESDQDYATQQDSQVIHIAVFGREPTTVAVSGSSTSTASSSAGEVIYSIQAQYHNSSDSPTPISGSFSSTSEAADVPNKGVPGYQECTNCGSWIPERTMMLHSNFCHRNNAKCNKCGLVMKKEDLPNHFHCDHCNKVPLLFFPAWRATF